jgi:aryl carrier-like protein
LSRGLSYSAANAFLDSLVESRRAQGLAATSIQWGAVAEVGMANRGDKMESGDLALKMISPKMVVSALEALFSTSLPSQLVFARSDWPRFVAALGMPIPILQNFQAKGGDNSALAEALRNLSPAEQRDHIKQVVLNVAKGVLQQDALAADAPLMEAGMDSLTAVEFRNRLTKELPGVKLSNTVMFDYPTVDAIAGFALSQVAPAAAGVGPSLSLGSASVSSSEPLALVGMAVRFPGRCNSPDEYWSKLLSKVNGIVEVPASRWDIDEYFDSKPGTVGKMYVRRAGFVEDVEMFDASFFGVSPPEAKTMDPQQRMLLEVSYDAFYSAGEDKRASWAAMRAFSLASATTTGAAWIGVQTATS